MTNLLTHFTNHYWQFAFSTSAGFMLAFLFYGGLYVTVNRGLNSQHPALWFFSSFFIRMGVVMSGFYFISAGHWQQLIACLSGFVVTGFLFQLKALAKPKPKAVLLEQFQTQTLIKQARPYEP